MINKLFKRKKEFQTEYLKRLIETLKVLAAPPEIQLASFPDNVCKPDEIALTFDEYASRANQCELISQTAKSKISTLNRFFDTGIDKNEWTDAAVSSSYKWEFVRKSAREILYDMGVLYSEPNLYWIKYVVK